MYMHYYPKEYLECIQKTELPPKAAAALGSQTMSERLALLDETGMDAEILSVSQAQPYLAVAAESAHAAHLANGLYQGLCSQYPRRFYGFAALPLPTRHWWKLSGLRRAPILSDSPWVAVLPGGFSSRCLRNWTAAGLSSSCIPDPLADSWAPLMLKRHCCLLIYPVSID